MGGEGYWQTTTTTPPKLVVINNVDRPIGPQNILIIVKCILQFSH